MPRRAGTPRHLILALAATIALAAVVPAGTTAGSIGPAHGAWAEAAVARPAGVAASGAAPTTRSAPFSLDLSRPGDFVSQTNFVQCVGASMQMMLNMIRPVDDRNAATQLHLQDLARSLSGQRPDGIVRKGASVRGWTAGLNALGAGPYRTVGSADLQTVLRLAARSMTATGRPVGLLVWRGRHAWVMAGFTATADPLLTDDFEVTSVVILDPLYPYGSKAWGPSPRPRQSLSIAALGRQFVPRNSGTSLPGGGTDTSRTVPGSTAEAFRSWSAGLAGKYVIVAPYVLDRVARSGHWLS